MTVPKSFKERGLLSVGEVAERMQVHRATAWHWVKQGMLPAQLVGQRYYGISEKDLRAFEKLYVQSPPVSPPKKRPSKAKGQARAKRAAKAKPRKR